MDSKLYLIKWIQAYYDGEITNHQKEVMLKEHEANNDWIDDMLFDDNSIHDDGLCEFVKCTSIELVDEGIERL